MEKVLFLLVFQNYLKIKKNWGDSKVTKMAWLTASLSQTLMDKVFTSTTHKDTQTQIWPQYHLYMIVLHCTWENVTKRCNQDSTRKKIGSRKKRCKLSVSCQRTKKLQCRVERKPTIINDVILLGMMAKLAKKVKKIHPANRLSCMMMMIAKIGAKIWPGNHAEEPGRKVPGRVEREAAVEAEADSDRQNGETDVEGDQLLRHLIKWWWRWWRWRWWWWRWRWCRWQPPACSFYRWWRRHKELRVRWQGTGRQSLLSLMINMIETLWFLRPWAGGCQWMRNDSDLR